MHGHMNLKLSDLCCGSPYRRRKRKGYPLDTYLYSPSFVPYFDELNGHSLETQPLPC